MAGGTVAALLAVSAAAATSIPAGGPPFVPGDQPVHEISMTVDTAPGRDLLSVLAGGPDAPPALRRLRAYRPVLRAIEAEGLSVDQLFGRAVAVAAGTPDRIFSSVQAAPGGMREILTAFDEDGPAAARTLGRRTALLFLIPDEFFPLDLVLSNPIARSFARWNGAVRALSDPKRPEEERKEILAQAARGDFWSRYPGVVGIAMVDGLLRRSGRDAFVLALGSGPLAVAELYVRISKDGRLPPLGKEARRELDARLRGAGSPVQGPVRGPGAAGPD
jgi:hypothetical protein